MNNKNSSLDIFDENDYNDIFINNAHPEDVDEITFKWRDMEELPSEIGKFRNLKKFKIFLTDTKLISKEIGSLKKLEELSILCELDKIPLEIGSIEMLKKLAISGNFKVIPNELCNLKHLETLILGGNSNNLPNEIHQLTSLRELSVSGENLFELPKDFGLLKNLKSFKIDAKKLKILPDSFSMLKQIEEIDFIYDPMKWFDCSIDTIPEYFKEFSELRSFRINNIKTQQISNFISYWPKLEVLEMSQCGLNEIPIELKRCKNIRWLFLSRNNIVEIPDWIIELTNLEAIWAEKNKISKLPIKEILEHKNLKTLVLRENSFNEKQIE